MGRLLNNPSRLARKLPLLEETIEQLEPSGEETPSPWGEGRGEGNLHRTNLNRRI